MSHNHYDKFQDSKPKTSEVTESKTDDTKKESTTPTEVKSDLTPIKKEEMKQEEPKNEVKPEPKKETSVTKPEPKTEVKKPEPLKVTPPVSKTVATPEARVIKVGNSCKLKPTVKKTVNNQLVPLFAYNNTYMVISVLKDRIVIRSGLTYTLAVKPEDITLL